MSIEPPFSDFSQAIRKSSIELDHKTKGNFILLRHDIIEAFATLEQSVRMAIDQTGVSPPSEGAALGQQLDVLSKLKPSPKLSKSRCTSIVQIVDQAKDLIAVRNDIVHSHQYVTDVGEYAAVYLNTARTRDCYPIARILTVAQHKTLKDAALHLAKQLTNPPSPPQPLPGAADGP